MSKKELEPDVVYDVIINGKETKLSVSKKVPKDKIPELVAFIEKGPGNRK